MTQATTKQSGADAVQSAAARGRGGWAALIIVLVGVFVTYLDLFIVNVALPAIGADLHVPTSSVSLVVAAYGLSFAVGMIIGGRLGDLHGRRRLFLIGMAGFTLASAACAFAPTITFLVGARFGQGLAGALMAPQVLAIVTTTYAGRMRERAFAGFGLAMGIAGVLGQLVGGLLINANIDGTGWRAIFLINIPVGLFTLIAGRRWITESRGPATGLDLPGAALLALAGSTLVLPLVLGPAHHWPAWTFICLAICPIVTAGFVVYERRRDRQGRAPLVAADLLRPKRFRLGVAIGLVFFVPASFFFILAIYLQQGRGMTAMQSGLIFVAVGVGYFAAMRPAMTWVRRLGAKVITLGALTTAAGVLLLAATAHVQDAWVLTPGLALVGAGIGLVLVPLAAVVLADTPPEHAGAASGVLNTAQQIGGATGIALTSLIFTRWGDIASGFAITLIALAGVSILTAALAATLTMKQHQTHA